MVGHQKDEDDDAKPEGETGEEATAQPPRAPVSRPDAPRRLLDDTNLTPTSREPTNRPEAPRRLPEMPGGIARRADQPGGDDGKKLIVGRDIVVKGEIHSCDRLVVEGRVEASMKDSREIEIAETGTFKGQAEFDRADIRGNFEGDLTAREYLVVRATGRITGKVRFGELEIERGGQIVGEVQVFDEGAARRTHGDTYDDTDHSQSPTRASPDPQTPRHHPGPRRPEPRPSPDPIAPTARSGPATSATPEWVMPKKIC